MILNPYFHKKVEPNTFIGGIAKQGGEGANAPIDTSRKLATKLAISVNRISRFRINGDDVECNIKGDYSLGRYSAESVAFSNNLNITYYRGSNITRLVRCFMGCSNLIEFIREKNTGLTEVTDAFRGCKKLTFIEGFDNPSDNASLNDSVFRGCTSLEAINLLSITRVVNNDIFHNCTSLKFIDLTRCITGISGSMFYNCNSLERFENHVWTTTLWGTFAACTKITEIIIPKTTTLLDQVFNGCSKLELIDIRGCKIINHNPWFHTVKLGFLIKVHIDLFTSNGGNPNPYLVTAKNTRNAIVEFYDDNGDYVSTL